LNLWKSFTDSETSLPGNR